MKNDYKPIVTLILIGLNVIVYIAECLHGNPEDVNNLLNMGAAYTPYIAGNGEWYRLFTSMFLHFGIEHIASNMIALIAVGQYIEWYFGTVRYLVIYFVAGLTGNILFLIVEIFTRDFAASAGASGAISGLFGALIILAIDPRTKRVFSLPRILFGLVLLLIPSFGGTSVNIIAHFGGIVGGFITALIFYLFMRNKNTYIINENDEVPLE